ncbi:MAG: 30S ribosomal protein S14 [Alphaproteobacteria bacterium]|nr:30S ribosomal protein S14 [Alphaproteobacteria bacterium]
MAKKSIVENNLNRKKVVDAYKARRAKLKAVVCDKKVSVEERFEATLKLAELPRNGAKIRLRNRCALSGRPRGYYRKVALSRIALRDLASQGLIPGMTKSSW